MWLDLITDIMRLPSCGPAYVFIIKVNKYQNEFMN